MKRNRALQATQQIQSYTEGEGWRRSEDTEGGGTQRKRMTERNKERVRGRESI